MWHQVLPLRHLGTSKGEMQLGGFLTVFSWDFGRIWVEIGGGIRSRLDCGSKCRWLG